MDEFGLDFTTFKPIRETWELGRTFRGTLQVQKSLLSLRGMYASSNKNQSSWKFNRWKTEDVPFLFRLPKLRKPKSAHVRVQTTEEKTYVHTFVSDNDSRIGDVGEFLLDPLTEHLQAHVL